jgi:hypothetical protein
VCFGEEENGGAVRGVLSTLYGKPMHGFARLGSASYRVDSR